MSSEGSFLFNNTELRKIEGENSIFSSSAFEHNYKNYAYDSYSECVSKSGGAILPQKRRIIGSTGCLLSVKFVGFDLILKSNLSPLTLPVYFEVGPSLTPYSTAGTPCEVQWTELYACNNGGGMSKTTVNCKVEVHVGLTTNDKNATETKEEQDKTSKDSDTNSIDKTSEVTDTLMSSLGMKAEAGVEATLIEKVLKENAGGGKKKILTASIGGGIEKKNTDTMKNEAEDKAHVSTSPLRII